MEKADFADWAETQTKEQIVEELMRLNKCNKEQADELLTLRQDQDRVKKEFHRIYEELKQAHSKMPNLGGLLADFYINLNDVKL
jgi:septal ring factor EnvC (AmiA/AmiB activator)|tara:strand:- start:404 stop:655 length:252 start_codon:yes stop_codon:yes gene_type:complete